MKKNQPPPLQLSVQERIKLYEQTAADHTSSEILSSKSTPQSKKPSPALKEKQQRHSVRNTTAQNEEETLYATAALQTTTRVLSEAQIMKLLPHSQLVKAYQEKIQSLCKIVYGNENLLQEKIGEIQKNPTLGESLSWQISAQPESFSKLAGFNLWGIKNSARKNAEENLPTLCDAIAGYGEAVQYAREDLSITPDAVLTYYEQSMGREAVAKILQSSNQSEKENAEISTMIQQNPTVTRYQARIKYWCHVVFGKSNILASKMEEILHNPAMAEELTWQLAAYPQSLHNYAGMKVCGLKNSVRRHAEAGLPSLIDTIDNYANAVHLLKESLVQSQQLQQKTHAPSAELAKDLKKQKDLTKSSKLPEYLSSTPHHEARKTSQQTHERTQDTHSRKKTAAKTMAFAS
ncbi:BID domain-containing T4SS effector [Bartonella vinsonii]|uniref:Protein involved in cell division n=1 Tax=Bartonella vinsonii TaxID=33047 RepID=A0A448V851_BARVI|nr:BID domain-containing T4SS effector [Bartonella vinsonii]VEJ45900.1 Protein involved in cell division [Bartonella vinsonii]